MGLTRDCPRRLRISSFLLLCRFALLGQWEMGPAALPPDLLGGARPLWAAPASDAPALRRWEGFSGPRGCSPPPVGALSGRGPAGRAAATASATPRPLELLWPRAPSLPASGPPLCFWPNPGLLPAPASAFLRCGLRLDDRRAHPDLQLYPWCCGRPRPARSLLGSRQRSGLPPCFSSTAVGGGGHSGLSDPGAPSMPGASSSERPRWAPLTRVAPTVPAARAAYAPKRALPHAPPAAWPMISRTTLTAVAVAAMPAFSARRSSSDVIGASWWCSGLTWRPRWWTTF